MNDWNYNNPERFPEQYPAVVDEWAEPVASDNAELATLRPLLKNTNLEFRDLKLTYSANRDGWNADSFHRKVDKLGGGLVVCTTTDGLVCGGCKLSNNNFLGSSTFQLRRLIKWRQWT